MHCYNRSQAYEDLRRLFGASPSGLGRGEEEEDAEDEEASLTPMASTATDTDAWDWRSLVPSIRVSLSNVS